MSIYNATVPQYAKMLRNLDSWLETAIAFAEEKSFDADVLLSARLAPDQFSLVRQIQTSCDTAKFGVSRLTATEAPSDPDTETTMAEIRARIASTIAFVESKTEADFEGAADRDIALPFLPGHASKGGEYLNAFALPNFYFHISTAYAILRHNGVSLTKHAFIGGMDIFPI